MMANATNAAAGLATAKVSPVTLNNQQPKIASGSVKNCLRILGGIKTPRKDVRNSMM
jgi:hypothetical protein